MVPERLDDFIHPCLKMAAVGTERYIQHFRGHFLGGRRLEIGVMEGAIEFGLAGGSLPSVGGFFDQRPQRDYSLARHRRVAYAVHDQA